jgi:signal transduction histidine kinase
VDTVREPLLLLSGDLRIVLANAAFYRTFGLVPTDVERRLFYEISRGEWDIPALRVLLEELLPAKTELADFEVARPGPSAGARTLLLNARRLRYGDEQAPMILLAFEDVTERRRLEQVLRGTLAELERSNHELQSFASIASHDLQEPLRKIRAFGERLEAACEGQLPPKGRVYLERMTAAAVRMQQLITDLLSLARVRANRKSWRRISLEKVVAEVLSDLEEALRSSGGRVEIGRLPEIEADPTQMRQLFQNLISNALKFRGADPPVVTISAEQVPGLPGTANTPATSANWRVVVADNGIGFEPKYAERIFRPFERLHARGVFEGTGIGLAICHRILMNHEGSIHAESQPGRGTRIAIHFPATQRDTYDDHTDAHHDSARG